MIYKENESFKRFVAVTFSTSVASDLSFYLLQEYNIILELQDPYDFLSTTNHKDCNFINLVTQDFKLREQISKKLSENFLPRFTFIHKSSVTDSLTIGLGCFIYPMTVCYPGSSIGQDCIIHSFSLIAHKSFIGKGCILSGGVKIAGSVKIGNFSNFGLNVTVYDKVTIPDYCYIGARCIVRKNINRSGRYGFGQKNQLIEL